MAKTQPTIVRDPPPESQRLRLLFIAACLIPLIGLGTLMASGSLRKSPPQRGGRGGTYVKSASPSADQTDVNPLGAITLRYSLAQRGRGLDRETISAESVGLVHAVDGTVVVADRSLSPAGDVLTIRPLMPLEPQTAYALETSSLLKDVTGRPAAVFALSFTTAAGWITPDSPVGFERAPQDVTPREYTVLEMGPDGHLYAGTADGEVIQFDVLSDGTLNETATVTPFGGQEGRDRAITGLGFDPASTNDALIVWLTYTAAPRRNPPYWSGGIGQLSGASLGSYTDVVTGLPRAAREGLSAPIAFGPDQALYVAQPAMTIAGAPTAAWDRREETRLSAAVLRLDPALLGALPLDVRADRREGAYDPGAGGAPVTIYATGVRAAAGMLWHSRAGLLATMVASQDAGATPAAPDGSAAGLGEVAPQPHLLMRVEAGGYHGHPSPARSEHVLNGGNPTDGADPVEVIEYPTGTMPEPNWRVPAYVMGPGAAPGGAAEYSTSAFGGVLDGTLLLSRGGRDGYLAAINFDSEGSPAEVLLGIPGFDQLDNPGDLSVDARSGCIYIIEGRGQITMLRPMTESSGAAVFRQTIVRPG